MTDATLHPRSFLAHLTRREPLINAAGQEPLRSIPYMHWDRTSGRSLPTTATLVAVDHGNDAFKGAMLHAHQPLLQTTRIITAYAPAKQLGSGDGITTWWVDASDPFWIGEDALQSRAESLPIGMTEPRLADARSHHFLFACLVELLVAAGYGIPSQEDQGEHNLYLALGLPNEEIQRSGIQSSVQRALIPLLNTAHTVRRQDEQGHIMTWVLRLVELNPYPQTFGSFVAWYYTLEGTPIDTNIVNHVTLDIGGGHMHACEVNLQHRENGHPKLHMTASLLEEGTIVLARDLQERIRSLHPGLRLSEVEAQQVLVTKNVILEGRFLPVNDLVADCLAARAPLLLKHLRHHLHEERSFLLFTGGGSLLLASHLEELRRASQRTEQSSLCVSPAWASVLNAVGGYMLAQVSAQKQLELLSKERVHE